MSETSRIEYKGELTSELDFKTFLAYINHRLCLKSGVTF